jgi:hypothetical protein
MFCERTAIKTTVLEKGCVEARSELRGKKRVVLKPHLAAPTITWSHDNIAHGHISERQGKEIMMPGSTSEFNPMTLIKPNLIEGLLFHLMISRSVTIQLHKLNHCS